MRQDAHRERALEHTTFYLIMRDPPTIPDDRRTGELIAARIDHPSLPAIRAEECLADGRAARRRSHPEMIGEDLRELRMGGALPAAIRDARQKHAREKLFDTQNIQNYTKASDVYE